MTAPGRARYVGGPLTQLLEEVRRAWDRTHVPGVPEPWQFRRIAYLLATHRPALVFDEGLFRWLLLTIRELQRQAAAERHMTAGGAA